MAGGFEFTTESLVLYKPVLDRYLNSPTGEVGQYLKARVVLMVVAAKRQVGVDTAKLRNSIHSIHSRHTSGQQYWVGSTEKHAFIHHQGTRPHLIVPNQAQLLRFSVGARMVSTRMVRHPGTKPNKYLSDQLYLVKF